MSPIKITGFVLFLVIIGIFEGFYGVNIQPANATTSVYQMSDTIASSSLGTYSGKQIQAEYVTSTSSLVGKSIDTIIVGLQKVKSPTGIVQVGVFNSDRTVKQLFGTIDSTIISTSKTDYTFSLPAGQSYTLQSGDRIGIKFTGGSASNYVSIILDGGNHFDGKNSYQTYYTNSWKTSTGDDLYMTLLLHIFTTSPSAPTSLTPTAGGSYISLSWTAPASDGGSAITGYNIYRGSTSGGEDVTPIASVGPSITTYDDTGLTNGQQYFYTVTAINSVGTSSASNEASAIPVVTGTTDPFGIKEIYPDLPGGMKWFSTSFDITRTNTVGTYDTVDPWLDFSHGDGNYTIQNGILSASPLYSASPIRIYIHNPDLKTEWNNIEITAYGRNDKMDTSIPDWSWSGLMAYGRTNHGTNADESINLCDDRGYGGRLKLNGDFDFEKETRHEGSNGYDQKALVPVWTPNTMPLNQWIGYKFVIYDKTVNGTTGVQLEQWIDKNADGTWVKVSSFFDDGTNFGLTKSGSACATGVNPKIQLTHDMAMMNSETGKPDLSVYFRTDGQWMSYKDMSVREIVPPSS